MFSAADVIKMGGSESSKPIDVSRGGDIEVTNVVGDWLLTNDRRSWQEISDDGESEVVSEPEPVSDDPVAPEGDKTEADPGDAPTTEEARPTVRSRPSRSQ
jgi:hypothetical protein